jgi:hypothetical protein
VKKILLWCLVWAICPAVMSEPASSNQVIVLFNGRNLDGWDTLLGPLRPGEAPLGRNNDPHEVFSVVKEDGAPAIHISGEVWGALVTRAEFENYRLYAQFKWGVRKWAPREKSVRDSGILYHCVGSPDPRTGWMRSFECQIEEQDCGDFWSVRGAVVMAETRRMDATRELREQFAIWCDRNEGKYAPYGYWPGGLVLSIKENGLMKSVDAERPKGQWNNVEILCDGDRSAHVINGVTNMVLTDLSQTAEPNMLIPLTRGKIQLQSEGAEIFFRNLEVHPIAR